MKPWRSTVTAHVERWSIKLSPGGREWWPKFVYHYTHLTNALGILESGAIFSRAEAVKRGLMKNDNASPSVIASTRQEHLNYVRLYFRPRTPTQYHNEGFRPPGELSLGSHCPMPFFFCFDAVEIILRDGAECSDGNMGKTTRVRHSDSEDFFASIPFNLVFHDSWVTDQDREDIVFHRHAEVLIPTALPLDSSLRMVACRSVAERMTLLHGLKPNTRRRWEEKVRVGYAAFFMRQATVVENVAAVGNILTFNFNPDSRCKGAHTVEFSFQDQRLKRWTWTGQHIPQTPILRLKLDGVAVGGVALLKMDGITAFHGYVAFASGPF